MNYKIREFLSKHENTNLIVYPKGVTYVENESIFTSLKNRVKIIKINVCGDKKNKRK